jgi:hypothetical protein
MKHGWPKNEKKTEKKLFCMFVEVAEGRFVPMRGFANSVFVQGRSVKESGDPSGSGKSA